jgi:flagellar biogenesis protein FliO
MDLTSKRKHENALLLWLLIIGALLAALLLGGAIGWIVRRIWRRRRGRENHQQIGKADGTAQRKTTVAALAEAVNECTSTPSSKS